MIVLVLSREKEPSEAMTRGQASSSGKLRIAICHPDLGIGGAERLVVDAAMELSGRGHEVHIFTAHHDRQHCFEETLGGFCRHPCFEDEEVVQGGTPILFYCHFPDMLLAQHTTTLRKLYRKPLDWLEETTTGKADLVLVNSEYTASTFGDTFKSLHKKGIRPSVLYPAVDVSQFYSQLESLGNRPFFLSINRFERKKNIGLAISAFAAVRRELAAFQADEKYEIASSVDVRLVVAGGYDERLAENREYLQELKSLVSEEGVPGLVDFEPSCSTARKNELLASCIAVIYTPMNEHFGIVPLEAMASAKPVIACNSGGPKESVEHSVTGFLCDPSARSFSSAMNMLLKQPGMAEKMGLAARKHVENNFSRTVFGEKLKFIISDLLRKSKQTAKQVEMSSL